MRAFLLAVGFIVCFVAGGYVSFKVCEYYNRLLRMQMRGHRRMRRCEPDADDLFVPAKDGD